MEISTPSSRVAGRRPPLESATDMSSNPPAYETRDARSYQAIPQEEQDARIDGDVDPDDFKVGVTVEQSTPEIRSMFVRKVRVAEPLAAWERG